MSGQFVVQYDVDRDPGAGDVQVSKHWVFNGGAGTRSRARQGSLWSSMMWTEIRGQETCR